MTMDDINEGRRLVREYLNAKRSYMAMSAPSDSQILRLTSAEHDLAIWTCEHADELFATAEMVVRS